MLGMLGGFLENIVKSRLKKKKEKLGAIKSAFDLAKQGKFGESVVKYGKYKYGADWK